METVVRFLRGAAAFLYRTKHVDEKLNEVISKIDEVEKELARIDGTVEEISRIIHSYHSQERV